MIQTKRPVQIAGAVLMVLCVMLGCADRRDRTRATEDFSRDPEPQPLRTDEPTVDRLASAVLTARDTTEEADALKRLWKHMSDEQLTYELKTYVVGTNRVVDSPADHQGRLRAQMQVFRGKEKIYQFSFIPQENSNLSLLGGES